jgi:ElaB/YqjD/DUF883 family membrane-anchored ribosome-binding protein
VHTGFHLKLLGCASKVLEACGLNGKLFMAHVKPVEGRNFNEIIIMENLTEKTRDALVKDVGKLKNDAARVAQDVRDHATAHVDETRQRVSDTILTIREGLTTHPLTLIGMGFAFGLLLGFRFRR